MLSADVLSSVVADFALGVEKMDEKMGRPQMPHFGVWVSWDPQKLFCDIGRFWSGFFQNRTFWTDPDFEIVHPHGRQWTPGGRQKKNAQKIGTLIGRCVLSMKARRGKLLEGLGRGLMFPIFFWQRCLGSGSNSNYIDYHSVHRTS